MSFHEFEPLTNRALHRAEEEHLASGSFVPFSTKKTSLRKEITDSLDRLATSFQQGRNLLFDELEHYEDFRTLLPSSRERSSRKDLAHLSQCIQSQEPVQQALGYSNDLLLAMYQMCCNILEAKRHQEATQGFIYLTLLNPSVPSFWIGLGCAHEQGLQWDSAEQAFRTCIRKAPYSIEGYRALFRCFHRVGRDKEALSTCEEKLKWLENKEETQEQQALKKELTSTATYLRFLQGKLRK